MSLISRVAFNARLDLPDLLVPMEPLEPQETTENTDSLVSPDVMDSLDGRGRLEMPVLMDTREWMVNLERPETTDRGYCRL